MTTQEAIPAAGEPELGVLFLSCLLMQLANSMLSLSFIVLRRVFSFQKLNYYRLKPVGLKVS